MRKFLTLTALVAVIAAPQAAHAGEPAREVTLLKAMPIRAAIRQDNRHAWHQRVQARRERRREAAQAAAAAAQPAPSSAPTYTGGGSWADELAAVGFPAEAIPTMLYYIERESGGDPSALNPTSNACGLTQIYPYVPGCLDPMTNLRLAYAKYRASGFAPWGG